MANKDFTLKSGAKLHISSAPFPLAIALHQARMRCYKGKPLASAEAQVAFDVALDISTSPEIQDAFFACAASASYDDIRITVDLFNDPKVGDRARGDYMEIMKHVIEVNCGPFFTEAVSA